MAIYTPTTLKYVFELNFALQVITSPLKLKKRGQTWKGEITA